MKDKLIIYSLLGLLIAVMPVIAQENKIVEKKTIFFQEQLNLSDSQIDRIYQILIYAHKQAKEEHELNKENHDALLKAIKARNKVTDQQIKQQLTKEQNKKYDKIINNRNDITNERTIMLSHRLCLSLD